MGLIQALSGAKKAKQIAEDALMAAREKTIIENITKFGDEFFSPARAQGATLDPLTGRFIKAGQDKGYAMATIKNKADNEIKDVKGLIEFAKKPEIMNRLKKGQKLGGWVDEGKLIVDPTRIHSTKLGSLVSGVKNKQKAGFDIDKMGEYTSTKKDLAKESAPLAGGVAALATGGALANKKDFRVTPKEGATAAGLTAMIAAGLLTKGRVKGLYMSDLLKSPKEGYKELVKGGTKAVKPSALENVVAAKDYSYKVPSKILDEPGWDSGVVLTNAPKFNGKKDILYTNVNTGQVIKKSQLGGKGLPKEVAVINKKKGTPLPSQSFMDAVNINKGKKLSKNSTKERIVTIDNAGVQKLLDEGISNIGPAAFTDLLKERNVNAKLLGNRLERSLGGVFNNTANKVMDQKFADLAATRPELVEQIQDLAKVTGLSTDKVFREYINFYGKTNSAGVFSRLGQAIAEGQPDPSRPGKLIKVKDFTKKDKVGDVITEDKFATKVRESSKRLREYDPFNKGLDPDQLRAKSRATGNMFKYIDSNGKEGVDTAILDNGDLQQMLNLGIPNETIAGYFFKETEFYDAALDLLNSALKNKSLMTRTLNRTTKDISGMQSILRNRKDSAG